MRFREILINLGLITFDKGHTCTMLCYILFYTVNWPTIAVLLTIVGDR